MLNTAFSPWPSFTSAEADCMTRVLLSNKVNYWTGEECRKFETEFAEWSSVRHAVALANGTIALDAALKALRIGPGDEVIVTPRTFIASASSIANAGATPVFADVDRDSQNITAQTIREALTPRTKAIVCVHLAGWPCDMDPIMELAESRNLYVIEDCAQAHGARYKDRPVGSIGHIGAWSFCHDKIITTGGEGGMITTNNRDWWSLIWSFKDHGKSWEAVHEPAHRPGFRWLHDSFGTNARMLEVQAAIGRMQLQRLPEWSAARRRNAARIADVCRGFPVLRIPRAPADVRHAYYRFYAFVDAARLAPGWSRDRIIDETVAAGVPCYHGSCPEVYLEKAFEHSGHRPPRRLPVARELGETSMAFLVHPTLTQQEIDKTCTVLRRVLSDASVPARDNPDPRLSLAPDRASRTQNAARY
jgi:dTDP-4-amino-4,6-dideoxygalactose transaminase